MTRVLRLVQNVKGRDFVVGDLHGSFHLLVSAMRMVQFDKSVDRILSVGDVIDRGPDSARVLEFLDQDFVVAAQGNHEAHFANTSVDRLRRLAKLNRHGLRWVGELETAHIEEIQQRLLQLPIVIEVPTNRGLVGLVHADVPEGMDWPTFVRHVESGCAKTIKVAQEGRRRADEWDCSGVAGISRIFVGHTVMDNGPVCFGNVYAIDTGAVYYEDPLNPGSLTVVQINGDDLGLDLG